jgi:hypothetical protein
MPIVDQPWIDDGPMTPNPPEPSQPPGSPPKHAPWPSPHDGDIVYCVGQDRDASLTLLSQVPYDLLESRLGRFGEWQVNKLEHSLPAS